MCGGRSRQITRCRSPRFSSLVIQRQCVWPTARDLCTRVHAVVAMCRCGRADGKTSTATCATPATEAGTYSAVTVCYIDCVGLGLFTCLHQCLVVSERAGCLLQAVLLPITRNAATHRMPVWRLCPKAHGTVKVAHGGGDGSDWSKSRPPRRTCTPFGTPVALLGLG